MQSFFDQLSDEELPSLSVILTAMVEIGRPFATATYELEGDSELVFSSYKVFDKCDEFVRDFRRKLPDICSKACVDAAAEVTKLLHPLTQEIEEKTHEVTQLTNRINVSITVTDDERNQRQRRIWNYNDIHNGRVNVNNTDDVEARRLDLEQKRNVLEEHKNRYEEYKQRIGCITVQDFEALARTAVEPSISKYSEYFLQPYPMPGEVMSDLMRVKHAFKATKLFDPFYLETEPNLQVLVSLVEDLRYFDFPEFKDDNFISQLVSELPHVVILSKREFNWEGICESSTFHERARKRLKKKKQRETLLEQLRLSRQDEEVNQDDSEDVDIPFSKECYELQVFKKIIWKNDPGERGRRIYNWWISWILANDSKISAFARAVRLVVLVQPSSAACERVFSQLQYIRRACGDKLLEDLLELRLLLRCNRKLEDCFCEEEDLVLLEQE